MQKMDDFFFTGAKLLHSFVSFFGVGGLCKKQLNPRETGTYLQTISLFKDTSCNFA